jgi:hypothetical protein
MNLKGLEKTLKENITEYKGNPNNYNLNRFQAAIGVLGGLLISNNLPGIATISLGYGGLKIYQAWKDSKYIK